MSNCLNAFILECGRAGGILQSDNETTLLAVLQQAATKVRHVILMPLYIKAFIVPRGKVYILLCIYLPTNTGQTVGRRF